jgi:NAD(P)-dependent dehydrogenase (short-subunit alcohol dehydrogenase family)
MSLSKEEISMTDTTKVAVITGGGKGIGAEIARHLLLQNMNIVIAEMDMSLKSDILNDPSRLFFMKTDVKSESSVKNMIQQTVKHFKRIDVLINNAGILPNNLPSIENMPLKTWDEYINTNLTGAFLCTKHAIPHLRKSKGSIINIASTRALQSEGNDEPYSASKGGLVALTHALAVSLGPDIKVNCISPGWINTGKERLKKSDHQQHPSGRVGKPQDIASFVSFLVTQEDSFITGQNFIIDGGMTIKMIYV